MVSNLDIYGTAAIVVKKHGEDAATHAAMRADKLMDVGDMDGRAVWLRVIAAIKELLATESSGSLH